MRYDVRVPKNWEKETDKIYAKGMLRLSSRHEEVLSFPEALPSWKSSARKTSPPVIWGVFWFPSPQSLLSSISSFSSSSSKFFWSPQNTLGCIFGRWPCYEEGEKKFVMA